MRRAVLPGVVAAWIACAGPSCSSTDVTLATLPSGDDAAPPPSPPRCASTDDCPPNTYCEKTTCDSPSGTCLLSPTECDNDEMPVCGCDGQTYFNHCWRQAYGATGEASQDACQGFTCGGPANVPCPDFAYCAQLGGPGHCSPMAEGNCWFLPTQCPPPVEGGNLWDACQQPGPHCLDTCDAVRMGGSYSRSLMCP